MTEFSSPHVISADRIDGEVLIEFEDGRCGIFSSNLLYDMLAHARPVQEADTNLPERAAENFSSQK